MSYTIEDHFLLNNPPKSKYMTNLYSFRACLEYHREKLGRLFIPLLKAILMFSSQGLMNQEYTL